MCDTAPNHNTGWKVVKAIQRTEFDSLRSRYGTYTYLYLRCRTKDCIETLIDRRAGAWTVRDFD